MEIGTGIAIAGIAFSAMGIFYRIIPPKSPLDGRQHCQDHSGIVEGLKAANVWLSKIDGKVDQLLRNGRGQ
jgi:hypothetical protein